MHTLGMAAFLARNPARGSLSFLDCFLASEFGLSSASSRPAEMAFPVSCQFDPVYSEIAFHRRSVRRQTATAPHIDAVILHLRKRQEREKGATNPGSRAGKGIRTNLRAQNPKEEK
jgi:hypothetical protein